MIHQDLHHLKKPRWLTIRGWLISVGLALALLLLGQVLMTEAAPPIGADQSDQLTKPANKMTELCYATIDAVTVYTSTDSQALRDAASVANTGEVVKVAGTCEGVASVGGHTQVLYVDSHLTIQGGYTNTNWTVSDPVANPTILDANAAGRVIYVDTTGVFTASNITLRDGQTFAGDNNGCGLYNNLGQVYLNRIWLTGMNGTENNNGNGIYNNGGYITLVNSTVSNNIHAGSGVGLLRNPSGTFIVDRTVIHNNNMGPSGYAAIWNTGTFSLTNSTVSYNTGVAAQGGAIQHWGGTTNLFNNTIINNAVSATGGGVTGVSGGVVNMGGNLVSGHQASFGDDIYLQNIIFNNSGYNLFGDSSKTTADAIGGTAAVLAGTDITATSDGTDPTAIDSILDTTLADNGGDTQTHALVTDSPAIDHIPSGSCFTDLDQRGYERPDPIGGACDVGAYEDGALPPDDGGLSVCFATIDATTVYSSADSQAVRDAVAATSDDDLIKIAGYCAGVDSGVLATLNLNITLQGGYTITNWTTPDYQANPTTLDAEGAGQVIYIGNSANVTIDGLNIINGNQTTGEQRGGGIQIHFSTGGSALTVTNSYFENNTATNYGGAIDNGAQGPVYISNTTFFSNSAGLGGAAITINAGSSEKMLSVSNSTFQANQTDGVGGAIGVWGGEVEINHSSLISNTAGSTGGAIYSVGDFTLTNSQLADNQGGTNSSASGGAIYASGVLAVENSTFAANQTSHSGGAIFVTNKTVVSKTTFMHNMANIGGAYDSSTGSQSTIVNTTFYSNTGSSTGGHIYIHDGGTLTTTNVTLSDGQSASGGGIYIQIGAISHLINTIIANSVNGGDCVAIGTLATNTSNLIEDGSCTPTVTGDPLLGPLQDNGGDTWTMALLDGSPAIDAGDDVSCPATDQRGVTRPSGSSCDIGAYEVSMASSCYATIDEIIIYSSADSQAVRDAVAAATSGDLVKIAGYCLETNGSSLVALNQTITLQGGYTTTNWTTSDPVANLTTLDADASGRVVDVTAGDSNITLSNLTIYNGNVDGTERGAGLGNIYSTTHLMVENVIFDRNYATDSGGAIYSTGPMTVTANSVFTANDTAGDGGAIYATAALYISDSTFENNKSDSNTAARGDGGAIYMEDAPLTVVNTDFISNTNRVSDNYGGAIYSTDMVSIMEGLFERNTAYRGGAIGIGATGMLTINGTTFYSNTTANEGGAIYNAGGLLTIDTATFDQNHADAGNQAGGGAIRSLGPLVMDSVDVTNNSSAVDYGAIRSTSAVTITNSLFEGNTVPDDTSILSADSLYIASSDFINNSNTGDSGTTNDCGLTIIVKATISDSIFTGNRAPSGSGAALCNNAADTTIINSQFISNTASSGGAIYNTGNLTLTQSSLMSNTADTTGGAIQLNGGMVTVQDSTFMANQGGTQATASGGAIYASGVLTVENSTFVANQTSHSGGAVFVTSQATVLNSTFMHNVANIGGAYDSSTGSQSTIVNTTFYSNTGNATGGHIYIYTGGMLTTTNVTLSDGESASGGGIYIESGATGHLVNTIVANSVNGGDCVAVGTLATNTNTLIEDGSCTPTVTGDPLLGPLQDNGGDTWTMALLNGSPAIDTGDNAACPATDQRGVARSDGLCDIGAFELDDVSNTLAFSKVAEDVNGAPLQEGDEILYTLIVTNLLSVDQAGVVITDAIPANTTYVAASAQVSQGSVSGPDPLVASIGTLSGNSVATFTFRVTVDSGSEGETIQNTATADSPDQPTPIVVGPIEPDGGGTVDPPASESLTFNKTAEDVNGDPLQIGDEILYTLVVTNMLSVDHNTVVITDAIPAFTNYVDASAQVSQGTVSGPDPLVAEIGTLASGGVATFTFRVTVNTVAGGQTVQNSAEADGIKQEPPITVGPVVPPDGGGVNAPPVISELSNVSTPINTPAGPVAFTISDQETLADDLILTYASSDTSLVPLANITLGGSGENRTWLITPTTDLTGLVTIVITVSDGMATDTDSFILAVGVNGPPDAVDDTYNVPEGVASTLTILDNDVDPDGDTLTLTAIAAQPTNGQATVSGNTIIYTPDNGYIGPDSLSYTISDGSLTDTTTVNLTVLPVTDLEVTQTFTRALVDINFIIVVKNLGDRPADGATFSDTLNSSVSNLAWSCIASNGATCTASGADNPFSNTIGNFPVGEVVTYTVHGDLGLLDFADNTATIMPPEGTLDLNMENNTTYLGTAYRLAMPIIFKNATPSQ